MCCKGRTSAPAVCETHLSMFAVSISAGQQQFPEENGDLVKKCGSCRRNKLSKISCRRESVLPGAESILQTCLTAVGAVSTVRPQGQRIWSPEVAVLLLSLKNADRLSLVAKAPPGLLSSSHAPCALMTWLARRFMLACNKVLTRPCVASLGLTWIFSFLTPLLQRSKQIRCLVSQIPSLSCTLPSSLPHQATL